MSRWPMVPLRDLFRIEKGRIGIKAATPGEFTLVTTGESYLSHNEAHFSGDAVCIPMISATGHGHASIKRLHHIQGDFAVGSILCACINRRPERVLARYIFHYLTARKNIVLIPLMQGSANVSLRLTDIERIEIPLPPLAEQRSIVSRLDTLADKTRQIAENLNAIEADAERLLAVRFRDAIANVQYRPMSDVAPLVRREVSIDPDISYTELGIRSFYKGTFQRRTLMGTDYSWQDLYRVKVGDLIFSNIMAWEQAIAVAKPEDNDCVGNHRMLTCLPAGKSAVPGFLWHYFTTPEGFAKIEAASPGTAARNKTLTAPALMAIEVPAPPLRVQQAFDAFQERVSALKANHIAIRQANAALVPATLERIFCKENACLS